MNENDLGKALLAGEGSVNVNMLTQEVLRRDRRRVGWLIALCIIAWMLVVMLPWATLFPMLAKVVMFMRDEPAATSTAPDHQRTIELLQIVKKGTMATFVGSILSMLMAAVCTVMLIVMSRRATLRQVNIRLGEIADQLKLLANRKA